MTDEFLFGYERAGSSGLLKRLEEVQAQYGRFVIVCRRDPSTGAPRVGVPKPYEEGRIWTPFVTLAVPAEERTPDIQCLIAVWSKVRGRGWSADPVVPSEISSIDDEIALEAALEAYLTATDTVRTNAYLVPNKTALVLTNWAIESLAVPVEHRLVAELRPGKSYRVVVSCRKGNLADVEVCSVG